MDMKERLQELAEAARKRIEESDRPERLNEVKVAYLGKKGELTALLKGMNLEKGATAIERNGKIGGHNA